MTVSPQKELSLASAGLLLLAMDRIVKRHERRKRAEQLRLGLSTGSGKGLRAPRARTFVHGNVLAVQG